jgi:hypothetical protein
MTDWILRKYVPRLGFYSIIVDAPKPGFFTILNIALVRAALNGVLVDHTRCNRPFNSFSIGKLTYFEKPIRRYERLIDGFNLFG